MAQYWYCMIGPVEKSDLDYYGGSMDLPYREAVKKVHSGFFGSHGNCSSGWGISDSKYRMIERLINLKDNDLQRLLNLWEKTKNGPQ